MTKVFTIISQNEGAGKSTITLNLATWLSLLGKKILLIDSSSNASLTNIMNIKNLETKMGLQETLIEQVPFDEVIIETSIRNLFIIPFSNNFEENLFSKMFEEDIYLFRDAIDLLETSFDYIFIDSTSSEPIVFQANLAASDFVIINVIPNEEELEKITWLVDSIVEVKSTLNKWLDLDGVILNMYAETPEIRIVASKLREMFKELIFKTTIPKNISISESYKQKMPIALYDSKSFASESFLRLAKELISHHESKVK